MRTLRRAQLLPVVATLAFALSGCGAAAPSAGTGVGGGTAATRLDGDWRLVSGSLDGAKLDTPTTAPVTLTVDGADVTGRSACNSYFGSLDANGESVRITGLGGTDMACAPDVMALESRYLKALGLVENAARESTGLTLSGPGATLTYEPAPTVTNASFTGTDWTLESLIMGSGPDGSASSAAAPAQLRFDEHGSFTGTTGCGPIIGAWRLTDGSVTTTFAPSPPPGDLRPAPCLPAATAQLEQVTKVLAGPFTATISADTLTLTAADGSGLTYRAADPAGDPATDPAGDPATDPAGDPAGDPAADMTVDGTWLLTDATVGGKIVEIGTTVVTLELANDAGSTTAGCGTTAAGVDLRAGTVTFHLGPSSNVPHCNPADRDVESAYIDGLEAVTTYQRTAKQLVLSGVDVKLAFELITPTKPS